MAGFASSPVDVAAASSSGPAYSGGTTGAKSFNSAPVLNLGGDSRDVSIPSWVVVAGLVAIVAAIAIYARKRG